MRAVELVKYTTGVHVIIMSLALDVAQLQTHTHTETHVDNTIYIYKMDQQKQQCKLLIICQTIIMKPYLNL